MKPLSFKNKISRSFFMFLIVVCVICNSEKVFAQSLKFENLSLRDALAKAKKSNQIVFIQLQSECHQCNSAADEGLSGNEIGELFEKFICMKVSYNGDEYHRITWNYRILPKYPSSLFVDSDGNYLASMVNRSTSNRNEYIKLAANAMANVRNPPFKIYTDALSKGKGNRDLLKQYIAKLNDKNFNTDDLVEKYTRELTLKELEDTTELKFLISTAPLVNSNLYKLLHNNSELFSKVFNSLPKDERTRINSKTIIESKEKAIRDKDWNYMYAISSFIRGTYGKDYRASQKAIVNFELDFFHAIKDSVQYFGCAKRCYNEFIKPLKMDSVCKAELNQTVKRPDGAIMKGGILYQYGNQLNKMAFTIYQLSSDKEHLGFALKLSEQTLRYNYPPYIDTYAQILYKLGGKKDAIDWQQKAVNISDSLHMSGNQFKEVLAKMKDGSL